MPKKSEGEREILVAVSKLAAMLARRQDKTDEERNRGESCGEWRGKTIQIGKGQGARAKAAYIRKYHGHSHLLEAVKRESTYVHPHFISSTFAPNNVRFFANNDRVLQILRINVKSFQLIAIFVPDDFEFFNSWLQIVSLERRTRGIN